jgi:hypothetical protein
MPRLGSWGLRIVRDVLGLAHLALGQCPQRPLLGLARTVSTTH